MTILQACSNPWLQAKLPMLCLRQALPEQAAGPGRLLILNRKAACAHHMAEPSRNGAFLASDGLGALTQPSTIAPPPASA